jgi:hypothetical protein
MDDPPPLRSAIPHVGAAMLLPFLLGLGLRMAGLDAIDAAVATIVASVIGLLVTLKSLGAGRAWTLVTTILLVTGIPFIAASILTQARAIGPILDVPADEAGGHGMAAGFVFTDGAAPRADLAEVVTVVDTWYTPRGGPGRRQDTYVVAPVVPPGWTPAEPVPAVAVLASRNEYSRRVPDASSWPAPGGLLRLLDEELQTRAVRRALRQRGLVAADELVIGTWEASPGWARLDGLLPPMLLLGTGLLGVLGLAAFERIRPAARR